MPSQHHSAKLKTPLQPSETPKTPCEARQPPAHASPLPTSHSFGHSNLLSLLRSHLLSHHSSRHSLFNLFHAQSTGALIPWAFGVGGDVPCLGVLIWGIISVQLQEGQRGRENSRSRRENERFNERQILKSGSGHGLVQG